MEIKRNKLYFTCSLIYPHDYKVDDFIKIINNNSQQLYHILQVLNRRAPHVRCFVYPVLVQGSESAKQIVAGIEDMNKFGQMDLLIIVRCYQKVDRYLHHLKKN